MKVNNTSTGCPYLDEKGVNPSDMGVHLNNKLEVEVTSRDVINYCVKDCPYDHCLLEDTKRGAWKKNYLCLTL